MILTTLGLIALGAGAVACLWAGAKFKTQLQAIPFVGKIF